jgi:hypothetical protein
MLARTDAGARDEPSRLPAAPALRDAAPEPAVTA